ncbi:MAG: 1-phosphofructokinase family hexose kinase [Spirochaetales bacterium]
MSTFFLVVCLNPTLQKTLRLGRLVPGQVNRARSHRLDASGKGVNTTRILHQLGERAVHLTHGGGSSLATFMDLASGDGLDVRCVEGDLEIRHCYTLLDEHERSATEIVEPGWPVPDGLETAVRSRYAELVSNAHTVIITGSKAPGFSGDLYPDFVREARSEGDEGRGARILLDIRGDDLVSALPHRPSLVKINVNEFSATFLEEPLPEEIRPEAMPAALAQKMVDVAASWNCELVITNGSQPVMWCDGTRVRTIAPASVEPVNTIGSGDAMTAGIAAGLRRGAPIREAIELGLDCARRNVVNEKPGTLL